MEMPEQVDSAFDFKSVREAGADAEPVAARAAAEKTSAPSLDLYVNHAATDKIAVPALEYFVNHARLLAEAATLAARSDDGESAQRAVISEAWAVAFPFTDDFLF